MQGSDKLSDTLLVICQLFLTREQSHIITTNNQNSESNNTQHRSGRGISHRISIWKTL